MKNYIDSGKAVLGIEFGSTRIKAVLIGEDFTPIAQGAHDWENQLVDGIWTYDLDHVWQGLQDAYQNLKKDVESQYGTKLQKLAGIGISAMMHGYLAFNAQDQLLVPFRTWRNTCTGDAASELTELFQFNIPQRWSIAHLHQAILNGEAHVPEIAFLTTLAGYVHWKLTGEKVLGVGDASGMFPIDDRTGNYDAKMLTAYQAHIADHHFPWSLQEILPRVLSAGEDAGTLNEEGARLLDPEGDLEPGALMAPPEGDAGTGMAATNAVAKRTGNVSAGTSVFAMVVLEKQLQHVYPEIDMVTTPTGAPVAMVHCNNCTSDINAWADMYAQFLDAVGLSLDKGKIYEALFHAAMQGDKDCGGIVNVNYLSGEPVTGLSEGRPMLVRMPDAKMHFANVARSLVLGAIVTLKIGMDILAQEQVKIDSLLGHGGFFKTPGTAQKLLASALKTPVSVMETAGEGGPWGMALLAAYRVQKDASGSLESFLSEKVFAHSQAETLQPDGADIEGFAGYEALFRKALEAEKAAVEAMR